MLSPLAECDWTESFFNILTYVGGMVINLLYYISVDTQI